MERPPDPVPFISPLKNSPVAGHRYFLLFDGRHHLEAFDHGSQ